MANQINAEGAKLIGGELVVAATPELLATAQVALNSCKASFVYCVNKIGIGVADIAVPEAAISGAAIGSAGYKVIASSDEVAKALADSMIKSAKPLLAGGKLNTTSLTPIIEKEQLLVAANKKAIIENKDIVKPVVPKKSTYTYDEAINKVKNTGILANADNAIIDPNKITSYALNPNHPVGGDKAKVFESALGYNQSNALDLISKIQVGAKSNNAILNSADKFGQRITIDMPITGLNGKAVVLRTGWIYDVGSSEPRLTTLYIKKYIMKYKLFDVIALTEDILEHNLKAGMVGAIVDIYSEPEDAYEVEFCDKDGQTICILPLYDYQIFALE